MKKLPWFLRAAAAAVVISLVVAGVCDPQVLSLVLGGLGSAFVAVGDGVAAALGRVQENLELL